MNLYLFDEKEIILFTLPDKKIGNFWMVDSNGKNIINIEAKNNDWIVSSAKGIKLINNNAYVDSFKLDLKSYYIIEKDSNRFLLFVNSLIDNTFNNFKYVGSDDIIVGRNAGNVIVYDNQYINDIHIDLKFNGKNWVLLRDTNSYVYVNNYRINSDSVIIDNGDVINIFGLKIIVAFNVFFINNPCGNIGINTNVLNKINLDVTDEVVQEEILDLPLYKD